MTTQGSFKEPILHAYRALREDGPAKIAEYWEHRLIANNGEFFETENNQFTLEEILDDLHRITTQS